MHEEKLYELKEKLMKELAEYSGNGKFSKEDAEAIKYISSAIDHICNIIERMEDEGYSERGSYDGGGMGGAGGGNYSRRGGGGSYRDGGRYSREGGNYNYNRSYARGRNQNARRDSMGRYSRGGETDQMVEQLHELMQDAPNDQIRQQMQQLVQQLEQM